MQRTSCQVHTFDPTLDDAKRKRIAKVPGIHLHEYGLASHDGKQTILGIDAQVLTLSTIMREAACPLLNKIKELMLPIMT